MPSMWDLIIVGAGIAGLESARKWLLKNPHGSVAILEKYGYIGGRMVSFSRKVNGINVNWEIGAGRIHSSHALIRKVIRRVGCSFVPIPAATGYALGNGVVGESPFESDLLGAFQSLEAEELGKKTLRQLTDGAWGAGNSDKFWKGYPYDSEARLMRADLALKSFNAEMDSAGQGFSVCAQGLGEVCRRLRVDLEKKGAKFFQEHEVNEISSNEAGIVLTVNKKHWKASKVIVAVHSSGLEKIKGFESWPLLKKVRMAPLVRIYGVFPVKAGKPWFAGLGKFVTNHAIRFFIPVSEEKGIAMISYTDGVDAEGFLCLGDSGKEGQQKAVDAVMRDLRLLFSDRPIPDPNFYRVHGWTDGCTYWLPSMGKDVYDPKKESIASHTSHGLKDVFVVGESFSTKQAWIEGALEHVEQLFEKHAGELYTLR
jgi:monoamine oxidase